MNVGESKKRSALPYEDAKMIINRFEISGKEKFAELHKHGKIPEGIPANPHRVYKEKGFSWYDFLGNESPGSFLSFREERKIVRSLGISGKDVYQKLFKQ